MEIFYSKIFCLIVKTFISLVDMTTNSRLVERTRLLTDPQAQPLLHFFDQMKPTSTNIFLQENKLVRHVSGIQCPAQTTDATMNFACFSINNRTTPFCHSLLASISNARRANFSLRSITKKKTVSTCELNIMHFLLILQMGIQQRYKNVANFGEKFVL